MSPAPARSLAIGRESANPLIAGLAVFLLLTTVLLGLPVPTLFIAMLVAGIAILAVIRPEIGLHVLALNALVGLTRLVELPRVGPFSAVILVEGLLIGAILFQMAILRRRLHIGTPQHLLLGTLAVWIFISVLMGVVVGPENFQAYRNLFLVRLVMFGLVTILVASIEGMRRILVTFMISNVGLLAAAAAVRAGYFGEEKITFSDEFARSGAILQNPNELAFSLTTMLVLTLVALLVTRSRLLKVFLLGLAGADLIAIMMTLSRSGFVSMCVVLAFVFFKLTRSARALGIMALILLCVWLTMPEELFTRFTNIEEIQDVDRLRLARVGIAMTADNPVLGVGLGNYVSSFNSYNVSYVKKATAAHNMYLDLSAQMGTPALILYLITFGITWRGLRRMERDLDSRGETWSFEYLMGLAVQASFVNLAVFGLSGDVEFDYGALILLGLGLVLLREHAARRGSG